MPAYETVIVCSPAAFLLKPETSTSLIGISLVLPDLVLTNTETLSYEKSWPKYTELIPTSSIYNSSIGSIFGMSVHATKNRSGITKSKTRIKLFFTAVIVHS